MMLSVIRESYLAALPMFPILTIPSEAIGKIPDADAAEVTTPSTFLGWQTAGPSSRQRGAVCRWWRGAIRISPTPWDWE